MATVLFGVPHSGPERAGGKAWDPQHQTRLPYEAPGRPLAVAGWSWRHLSSTPPRRRAPGPTLTQPRRLRDPDACGILGNCVCVWGGGGSGVGDGGMDGYPCQCQQKTWQLADETEAGAAASQAGSPPCLRFPALSTGNCHSSFISTSQVRP
jgi:hypothetical protein